MSPEEFVALGGKIYLCKVNTINTFWQPADTPFCIACDKEYTKIKELHSNQDIISTLEKVGVIGYEIRCEMNKDKVRFAYDGEGHFTIGVPA